MDLLKHSLEKSNTNFSEEPFEKIKILVDALRLVSSDNDIKKSNLYIPDNCEEFGFTEGNHNLGVLLHFLADMLEE
jgi:hypothetical protein